MIILFAAKKQKSLTFAYLRAVWQIGVVRQRCLLPTDHLENVKMLREEGLIRLYCIANVYSVDSCSSKWGHIQIYNESQLLKQRLVRMGPHLLRCSSGTWCPSHAGLPSPRRSWQRRSCPEMKYIILEVFQSFSFIEANWELGRVFQCMSGREITAPPACWDETNLILVWHREMWSGSPAERVPTWGRLPPTSGTA